MSPIHYLYLDHNHIDLSIDLISIEFSFYNLMEKNIDYLYTMKLFHSLNNIEMKQEDRKNFLHLMAAKLHNFLNIANPDKFRENIRKKIFDIDLLVKDISEKISEL